MKILVITDTATSGGANFACWRLIKGLCDEGASVFHGCLEGKQHAVIDHQCYTNVDLRKPKSAVMLRALLRFKLHKIGNKKRASLLAKRVRDLMELHGIDAINLHNLHKSSLALHFIESLGVDLPIIWTLHDMWSFTGRCAYSYNCRKFESHACDTSCPTPGEYPSLEPSFIQSALLRKEAFISDNPKCIAVSPSRWLASEAMLSAWGKTRVQCIPNGLDLDVFNPVDKEASRRALSLLCDNRPLLLTVAENLGERRKGGGILQDFLESWDGVPIRILFLGNTAPLTSNKLIDAISLGFINDDILKRIVYSAADVMLHPARVDNLPNVVIESMACGTPVLGFSIGGMPDMVTSETGWLTSQVDHHGLIDLLEHVTQNVAEMKQKAKSAREYTEKNYSLPIQAKAYLELISTQK